MVDPMEKLVYTCIIHFGNQDPKTIRCGTCQDFKSNVCPGKGLHADGCLRCMSEHSKNSEMKFEIAS
jgi:hypothetical protein